MMKKASNKHPLETFLYCPQCGSKDFSIVDNRSRKCNVCNFHYYANAAGAVAALICNKDGELLLSQRAFNPGKGMWDLPGGFIDMNESAETALMREIKEELDVEVLTCRYCCSFPNRYLFSGLMVHTIDLFFEVHLKEGQTLHCQDDVCGYRYFPLDSIPMQELAFESIKKGIAYYLTKKSESKTI